MEYFILASKIIITVLYAVTLTLLCIFGLHRYYLSYLYKKNKNKKPLPASRYEKLPVVTIQLPIYNEMYVVERLIASVCKIDYPRDLLEIQVLDDSTDRTVEIASECVERFRGSGTDIVYIHRENREGYKAGALREGLKRAKGELLAVFDADFIPPAEFLRNTVDFFTDPGVGMVQVRWGHVNLDYSTLTKAQSILLDGHFMIEQTSRFNGGMFFNFNGTAGVLRKECIESSGGWQHDTLTEDLDLSYRAQLAGWKLVYLRDMIADAELPVDMNAFKSQQHRWAKGGVQTALKTLPEIFRRDNLPFKVKSEAFFHLFGNISYLLLLILFLLMFPMGFFWTELGWDSGIVVNVFAITAGTLSFVLFYIITVREVHGKKWLSYLKYVPLAISMGAGMAINNSKAVLEALLGKNSEFRRTPKFAVTSRNDNWRSRGYIASKEATAAVEIIFGVLFFIQTVLAVYMGYLGWVPFLILIQFGFLYTGLLSIFHGSGKKGADPGIGTIIPEPALQRDKDF
ncbi:MAG TPA: cellulose synthase family protein [Thermodesulfobacteriota bacterium]|nr:cellulose synthase family protein [Thermodesulfobacteriota bacterium]